ncbi:DUF2213 domain-containing protein [Acinetobacter pittii]|uniref:DUF2213 domain-containing protein n=1 Tax=Acinetobacter pittii TaxID=48296 RepID=UPI00029EBA56|nr:DUF2213 domain-containing protein [Acinetobacter pittii]EKU67872.1 PF09979 family protein [Acinetobacter pittii]KQF55975.1 hypothetical protein APC13_06270 [Acinetobacter pittii]KRJ09737.1 hypothetical protein APC76_02195 [Acinetobacter pittii]OTL20651.1 hypothetical protein B9X78_11905 [Acinetobacter pittii]WQD15596.1 DUF2213 domain-containing protein [Acinetobacter pittii]
MFKSKKTKDQKTVDRSEIYTTGQLGRTREITPEGYLLCRDVPIARIGTLMYADGEVPITADNTGLIIIYRGEDVLFHPITIASAEGKPVTDDHPSDWVTPDNWKLLSKGFVKDVRRGEGADSDYLMADILVTDKETIQKVLDGKVEISLGYDADYTETSKGKGLQSNIRVNHIALVEKGRCGSRCSIGDSFMSAKKTQKKEPWYQNLLGLKRTVDQALEEADKTVDSDDDDKTEDDDDEPEEKVKTGDSAFQAEMRKFMKTMDKRMSALEKKKTKDSDDPEKKTEDDDDPENKTKDDGDLTEPEPAKKLDESGTQTYTGDSLKEVISRAEILSPGYRMPTFDSANNGKAVLNTKRAVLKTAFATEDGQKAITPFVGQNPDFDILPSHTIDAAFAGASELIKQQNNAKGIRSGIKTTDFGRAAPTPAEINKRNREFWTNQG